VLVALEAAHDVASEYLLAEKEANLIQDLLRRLGFGVRLVAQRTFIALDV
jgi:hypothetical protein